MASRTPRFNRVEGMDLYKHWCVYRCSHGSECDECAAAKHCIQFTFAWMLRTLYDRMHRRHGGSNVVATHQGEMTVNEAYRIYSQTPNVGFSEDERTNRMRETVDFSTARRRLADSVAKHFPGIGVGDLGEDLPLVTGHYSPLMISDTLYQTLHNLYGMLLRSPNDPEDRGLEPLKLGMMLLCMHFCSLISFPISSVNRMWGQDLSKTVILLFSEIHRAQRS